MTKSSAVSLCLAGALCVATFQNALSQGYPAKPVRVLSTFTPGSVADGAMRIVAQKMSLSMGQPVVVEVQAGAGGLLAAQTLIRSAPDGYTILHAAPSTVVSAPFLQKNPPYHPLKDFTYITRLAIATISMLATVSLPVNTVKELIDYVRANPGKLAYGSNGVGATQHLEMELLKEKYGLDITHVPYKGGQLGLNAAAAGQIPVAFAPVASALTQVRAGKVKILAVMSVERYAAFPDLASMGEQLPDYEKMPTSDEMVGPAGMPAPIVRRLNTEIVNALKFPDVIERFSQIGFIPGGGTPEEHAAQIKKDMEVFA
ncbi:MAG: tripartite tricarboxylate transporter substrate binding protein [Sulfuricaulis sp.]|nr:tripartite tricarboxylate transporter substrate binding protein [Sulfuricaulis sp.]